MAIKLGNRPDHFPQRTVTAPLPDGSMGKVKYKGKYRTRAEYGALVDELAARKIEVPTSDDPNRIELISSAASEDNARMLSECVHEWDAGIDLDEKTLTQMADELPGLVGAILDDYRLVCQVGRLGN